MRITNLERLKMHIEYGASANQEALIDAHNELRALREWAADAREFIDETAMRELVTDDDRRPGEHLLKVYDECFVESEYTGGGILEPIQPRDQVALWRCPNGTRVRRDLGSPIMQVVGNFPNKSTIKLRHRDEYNFIADRNAIYEVISVPEEYYNNG